MARYFYMDTLAAAWMSKHFGMKFKSARGQNLYFDGGSDFRCEKDCGIYGGEYYYIHPDSLYLLRSEMDDVLETGDHQFFLVAPDELVSRKPYLSFATQAVANDAIIEGVAEIIQRNGLAFHFPESEEE